jgi:hypothetical protein
MGGQQSTINKLAMIRMGFMTHSKVQKVRFVSTEFQHLRNKMRENPHVCEDFRSKSGFQPPLKAGFLGIACPRKQKGTPLEKGALAGIFMILGGAPNRRAMDQARPR